MDGTGMRGGDWFERLVEGLAARTGADADEVAQRTRVAAWRWFGRAEAPRSWLARVARNAAREEARKGRRRRGYEADAAAERGVEAPKGARRAVEAIETRRAVLAAVEALPPELRDAIALRYLEDRPVAEVARLVGAPVETVRSRLARGRERLRRELADASDQRPWLAAVLLHPLTPPAVPAALPAAFALPLAMKSTQLAVAALLALLTFVGLAWNRSAGERPRAPIADPGPAPESPGEVVGADLAGAVGDAGERASLVPAPVPEAPPEPSPAAARWLDGVVVDLAGRPVAGASVAATGEGTEGRQVRSDRDGRFRWPADEPARLAAQVPEHVTAVEANAHGGALAELVIVVAPAIELSGRTVDFDGAPIAGVRLRLRLGTTLGATIGRSLGGGAPWQAMVWSDEEGRFELGAVPAVAGTDMWADPPGGLPNRLFAVPTATRHDLELRFGWPEEPRDGVALRLTTDGVTPRPDTEVRIQDWSRIANDQGQLVFPTGVAARVSSFVVRAPGQLPWVVARPAAGESVAVGRRPEEAGAPAEGPWPDELTVILGDQAAPTIRGRVVEPDGRPVEGATVWIVGGAPDDFEDDPLARMPGESRVDTDGDGAFTFSVLPGRTYGLRARHRPSLRAAELAAVLPGEGGVEIVLDTAPATCRVEGRCAAPDGTALAGVKVEPRYFLGPHSLDGSSGEERAISDEDGRFVLMGVPQDLDALDCAGTSIVPELVPVGLAADGGGDVRRLEVVLARRVDVRFDARAAGAAAAHAMLMDGEERALLQVFQWLPGLDMEGADGTYWAEFEGGLSPVYSVGEGAYRAVLVGDDGGELAKIEVRLVPGLEEATTIAFP